MVRSVFRLLSIIALSTPLSVSAQITIEASDFPIAGETYGRTNVVTADFDPTETGAGYTWDYSDLQPLDTQNEDYVDVSGAPFSYQFLFNNDLNPDYLATSALMTELDIGVDALNIQDPYFFYKADEDAYEAVGLGATVNGFPLPSTYDPIDRIYDLPLEVDQIGGSDSDILFVLPGLGLWRTEQTRTYEVDGYGTIITPYNTYDCLRTKTIINAVDSVYIDLLQLGQSIPRPETTVYQWLAKDEGVPVLEVTEQLGLVTQVRYKDEVNAIGGFERELLLTWDNQTLSWGETQVDEVVVYTCTGQVVEQHFHKRGGLQLMHLPSGIYLTQVVMGDQSLTRRLFVH